MVWFKIKKDLRNKPQRGTKYSHWKPELAKEGGHQCVYCAISENRFGGTRNFHVEHFKPKSISRFKRLENEWSNLYYSCSICNTFKSDDWKSNPDNKGTKICYIDPSKVDYSTIIDINWATGKIEGINIAIRYMIEKIFLNRPQLLFERRRSYLSNLLKEIDSFRENIHQSVLDSGDSDLIKMYLEFVDLLCKSSTMEKKIYEAIPYKEQDVKRN